MQGAPKWRSNGSTLPKQTLADRSDGEESVEPKLVYVCMTDSLPQSSKYVAISSYGTTKLISMQGAANWRSDGRTLPEQTLAVRSDRKESIEPKLVGVRTTDS